MLLRHPSRVWAIGFAAAVVALPVRSYAADLIMNGGTVTLGGVQTYGVVTLTNGAKIVVPPFNGTDTINTGNLVIRASSITIDATSQISAKGAGYQAQLCLNGSGPAAFPLSGGRGGCGVRDSAGGGAHFGVGGRGTKDCPGTGCVFPQYYEEDCIGAVNAGACSSLADCRNNDALPTVAGQPFYHSIYASEFGAAGGDKGCRDGDGFTLWPGTTVLNTGGNGGGRVVLVATTSGQTGTLTINGRIDANGNRGCGSGNDSAGGGAGGALLLIGDTVTVGATAVVTAGGGRGGDTQPKTDPECAGTQFNGTCDDCGGGGGGGVVNVLSRVASINPVATFNVSGALGGVCPICTGEAGGGTGELQIDGAYVGEICDGWDNDFNGIVDDGLPALNCAGSTLPSCVNGIPQQCPANTPACIGPVTDTRPRFVLVVDTSASMLRDVSGKPTFGDGSVTYPGVDTSSDADALDGNNSRLYIAKSALTNVLSAFPNADFALARYHQDEAAKRSCQTASWFECQKICCSYDDPRDNIAPAYPAPGCNPQSIYVAGYPAALNANINIGWADQTDCINYAGTCGPPRRGADVLVGFGHPLQQYLSWMDGTETNFNPSVLPGDFCNFAGGGDCELRATGPTPLAGAIQATEDFVKPVIQCDGGIPCRKYGLVLLTDGVDECQGNPVAAATALRTSLPGIEINTYVIGVSTVPSDSATLNAIAVAGGTGSAFFANDQNGIANAFATIIAASTNYERCNGIDDNCNGLVDEDFPDKGTACNDGLKGICLGTGVRVCNALQDGTVCQITTPGQAPGTEVCNGLDDNCNGLIDEGGVCDLCVPTTEVCNNLDDDCDGVIDNNLVDINQPCGTSLGECSAGTTVCQAGGVLACVGATMPQTEVCNGLDDDCNGIIDGMTQPCYAGPIGTANVGVCRPGSQQCIAVAGSGQPSWGTCVGQVSPSIEICDGLDNDCNGVVDDGVKDAFNHATGEACCRFGTKCGVGQCTSGVWACAGSQVVCDGGTGPTPEVCNSIDDDCNGQVDDLPGLGTLCATSTGCPGKIACDTSTQQLSCQPTGATSAEICNGIDDDCDGSIDEEPEVSQNDPAIGKECEAPVAPNDHAPCKAGKTVCKAGAPACEGAVKPSPEVCDLLDNDCDGTPDSPEPCPTDQKCVAGTCVAKCKSGEFPCGGGFLCQDGYCIPYQVDGGTGGAAGGGGSAGVGGKDGGGATGGAAGKAGGGASAGAGGKDASGVEAAAGSAATSQAGASQQADDNSYGLVTGGGGCACRTTTESSSKNTAALSALVLLAVALVRRRQEGRGA
jgi:MYXO-CTERM domain-containing protein